MGVVRAIERGTGWRWPAVVGLLFASTTGMNAGVIAAMQPVTLPVFGLLPGRRHELEPCRDRWLRCSVIALALSAYWIVPTLSALRAGNVVVENSESFTGIASTSSLAEVLRGLGIWPLYGADQFGPWVPEHVGYVRDFVLLFASFGFTMLVGLAAVRARGRLRLVALVSLTIAAIVMVGLYPLVTSRLLAASWRGRSTMSRGSVRFRTTNKAGAALVLSASLLVAVAARQWLVRRAGSAGEICRGPGGARPGASLGAPAFEGRHVHQPPAGAGLLARRGP